MPRIKRTKNATRSRRKKGEARLIRGVRPPNFGFPPTITTKLRYADNLVLLSTLGVRALNVYAANGIFDPDITGVGHQPLYRDNFAALYDQYVVIGSKITVTFASVTTGPMICGINGDDDSSSTLTVTTLEEQNNSKSCLSSADGGPTNTLTINYSPLRDIGVSAKDDGASATAVGANPAELYCFNVWAATGDLASTATAWAKVQIEYTVKFTELQTPVQN